MPIYLKDKMTSETLHDLNLALPIIESFLNKRNWLFTDKSQKYSHHLCVWKAEYLCKQIRKEAESLLLAWLCVSLLFLLNNQNCYPIFLIQTIWDPKLKCYKGPSKAVLRIWQEKRAQLKREADQKYQFCEK